MAPFRVCRRELHMALRHGKSIKKLVVMNFSRSGDVVYGAHLSDAHASRSPDVLSPQMGRGLRKKGAGCLPRGVRAGVFGESSQGRREIVAGNPSQLRYGMAMAQGQPGMGPTAVVSRGGSGRRGWVLQRRRLSQAEEIRGGTERRSAQSDPNARRVHRQPQAGHTRRSEVSDHRLTSTLV